MIEERRYSKRELARLYWPETQNIKSALKNLRHSYSAEQVRLIVKFLCEP